jgi:hypothetical protein
MALLVLAGGISKAHAVRRYGVSAKIVARRVERYQAEGRAGMTDRSSRPLAMPAVEAGRCSPRGVIAAASMTRRWKSKILMPPNAWSNP